MRALYSLVCRLRTLYALAQGTVTLVLDGWAALSPAQLLLLGCGRGHRFARPDPVAGVCRQRAARLNGSVAQHRRSRLCYRTGGHRCRRSMRDGRQTGSRSVARARSETGWLLLVPLSCRVAWSCMRLAATPAGGPPARSCRASDYRVTTLHRLIDGGARRRYYGRLVDNRANDDSQRCCEADKVVPARGRERSGIMIRKLVCGLSLVLVVAMIAGCQSESATAGTSGAATAQAKRCVVVWSEGTAPKNVYPNDINGAIAEGLKDLKGWEVVDGQSLRSQPGPAGQPAQSRRRARSGGAIRSTARSRTSS